MTDEGTEAQRGNKSDSRSHTQAVEMKLVWGPDLMYFITKLPWFNIMISKNSIQPHPTRSRVKILEKPIQVCIVSFLPLCLSVFPISHLSSSYFYPQNPSTSPRLPRHWVPAKEILVQKAFSSFTLLFQALERETTSGSPS